MKRIFLLSVMLYAFLMNAAAQSDSVRLKHRIGELITSLPDSVYSATLEITTTDSLEAHSIYYIVQESSATIAQSTIICSEVSTSESANPHRSGNVFIVEMPLYNPLHTQHLIVEFLNSDGVLIQAIESDL